MSRVKLKVLGLSYSQTQSGAYALVLGEESGNRRIPIIIGGFEAQSIAIELEGLQPPRPLTHDLFINFAKTFGVSIDEVNIHGLEDGIFYSELICRKDGEIVNIDTRTSDAVALAIRCKCPIYTTEIIMNKAGIAFDPDGNAEYEKRTAAAKRQNAEVKSSKNKYDKLNLKELKVLLDKSISSEDYEEASHIRDEIQQRESNGETEV